MDKKTDKMIRFFFPNGNMQVYTVGKKYNLYNSDGQTTRDVGALLSWKAPNFEASIVSVELIFEKGVMKITGVPFSLEEFESVEKAADSN